MSLDPIVIHDGPLDSALEAGATVKTKRSRHTSSNSIQGIEVTSSTTYSCERHWSLPGMTTVRATFTPEGFTHKLRKLFSSEIQVGDPMFDDAVFVSTNTNEATVAFLNKPGVQDAIYGFVTSGGSVSINRAALSISTVDSDNPEHLPSPRDEAALLDALISEIV